MGGQALMLNLTVVEDMLDFDAAKNADVMGERFSANQVAGSDWRL